ANWNEQTLAENPDFWRATIQDRVRRQWRSIRAYLRWYVQHFEQENPGQPSPKQAILLIRIYPIPEPGSPLQEVPLEQPLARWCPDSSPRSGELPIEFFDPVARCFVALRVKD